METSTKTYYVSVHHQLIQDIPDDSTEFTVIMSNEELAQLRNQMSELAKDDEYSFRRAFVPYKSADHDDATQQFDDKILEVYKAIYRYGDPVTKQTITDMNILPKLKNTNYHDKGYEQSPFNK